MPTVRHRLQLVTILGCLTWGGYQITAGALAQTAPNTSSSEAVASLDQDSQDRYPDLPPGVARAVQSVVAVVQVYDNAAQGAIASGVIISGEQILTAGHSVANGKGLACRQTTVIAPGMLTNASASNDSVTHASVTYGKATDLAVLTVRSSDNFRMLPDMAIASRPPEQGDKVYFINFQPTVDGKVRSPVSQPTAERLADYSKPAIFAGFVLGPSVHGTDIATGNGVSYGIGVGDTMVRKGASGGAIVNQRGELVGISVSSESLLADRTAASIVKDYKIALKDQRYQIAHMQPVGAAVVNKLQAATVSCSNSTR